ncbi:hypothetical protein [Nocardia flavorosea]|uniref:Luciferase-like monooxygenase n=1 Tax=Nocardia flavorosea TaxID=53429 RepID=A0A846YTJ4_9NOCA|nr:hypothetical protein [Nocardia flavorosea]NKY60592.1 hypothetical protein [Nocardia flavorosea]
MRIGVEVVVGEDLLGAVPQIAELVEAAGLDVLWWHPVGSAWTSSLVVAAASAAVTTTLTVAQDVALQGFHPLYLAEERHVTDRLLGGRLVTVLRGDADEQSEVAAVLLAAAAGRPFRHVGSRWTVPAGLEANSINREECIRVTPMPSGMGTAIWVGARAAAATGLPAVDSPALWAELDSGANAVQRHAVRPAVRRWDPQDEPVDELVARLRAEQQHSGVDLIAVRIAVAPGTAAWRSAVAALATVVRPSLQLERLPAGLEGRWHEPLGARAGQQQVNHLEEKT